MYERNRENYVRLTGESTKFKIMLELFNKEEHDRQCTYNATFRRVHATIVAVEKQYFLHTVRVWPLPHLSSIRSPFALLCWTMWPVWLYHNFPHYLNNVTIFGEKILSLKYVFRFSLQILSETFVTPRRIQRDVIINMYWSSCKVPVSVVRFI